MDRPGRVSLLLELPQELRIGILSYVGFPGLNACLRVCRSLQATVLETAALFYVLYLGRTGMCDNPESSLTPPRRLANLKIYNEGWRTLQWATISKIHIPVTDWFSLRQDLIVFSRPHAIENQVREYFRVPSPSRGVTASEWSRKLPAGRLAYTEDPSNDLFALLTGVVIDGATGVSRLRLLQLSTGDDHPSAIAQGTIVLQYHFQSEPPIFLGTQYILNGYFGCFIGNWTQNQAPTPLPSVSSLHGYIFLDAEHVATVSGPTMAGPSLHIYTRHSVPRGPGSDPWVLCQDFLLPPVRSSGLRTTWLARSPGPSPDSLTPQGDFYPDGKGALLSVLMNDGRVDEDETTVHLLVPSYALLSFISNRNQTDPQGLRVSWDEWGPANTHVYVYNTPIASLPPILYGYRSIPCSRPFPTEDGKWAFQVNDYHPGRIAAARAVARCVPDDQRNWKIEFGGKLDAQYTNTGDALRTRVPYIATEQIIPEEILGGRPEDLNVHLSENSVVIFHDERMPMLDLS
ncbi:hypothetical protein K488DRAFT_82318 [Vararia minispora EC-137]|uniref:Uncharacterized protein n=1 Tax=Vararia minispora EC-137 TaxID=1314806 RepID=A0ACB8QXE5_9AGAM|nr:hypothetical protein K488DRAFT_82318 [Vararia minispora EC-137]